MLQNAANGQAHDLVTTWAAFSGLLDSETIDATDWGALNKKVPGTHSKNVFSITEFRGHELSIMASPMKHMMMFQLTDAKVTRPPRPR